MDVERVTRFWGASRLTAWLAWVINSGVTRIVIRLFYSVGSLLPSWVVSPKSLGLVHWRTNYVLFLRNHWMDPCLYWLDWAKRLVLPIYNRKLRTALFKCCDSNFRYVMDALSDYKLTNGFQNAWDISLSLWPLRINKAICFITCRFEQ